MQQSLFGNLALSAAPTLEIVPALSLDKLHLAETDFIVLDLETTGLSAKKNAITEITAIRFRNGVEMDKYSTLVRPTEDIPEEVELLTGINNDMVRNAPAAVIALSELAGFIGDAPIIVGHNVSFDIGFLREKCMQNGLDVFLGRYDLSRSLCTRALALKALPGLPSYEGIVVATAIGYHNPNPHRAEADVRMSAGILFALIERLQADNAALKTVQDLLAWQGLLG